MPFFSSVKLRAGLLTALFLPLVICVCLSLPSRAAEGQCVSPACQTLERSITRVLSLIKNPDYISPLTRSGLRTQIEDEVFHLFDFGEFSARTVGQRWQSFTPEQKQAFTDAFAQLLFATYLNQIDGYNGEDVRYQGERSNAEGTRVEVATVLVMMDGRAIPINYRLMAKNGGWVIYDVFVEGVSLVRNYRTQFQEILARSTPDELIAKVREKAMENEENASEQ